ncbi:MAG: hypothetical protein CME41_07060 [Haliea sp.]|nr:hypothetical protein [Haliea sp.]|tara:strand:+ start:359 stop:892 length:534 start_codon:yes stop_codon:yes gene_type:complete
MKIKAMGAALVLVTGFSGVASANNGTIEFNGEIVANTCTVANADGAGTIQVTLPTLSSASFAAEGDRAGQTYVPIELSGCTPASGTVGVRFTGNAAQVDMDEGLFKNTGTATNVAVGVYSQSDDTQVKPGQEGGAFATIDTSTGDATVQLNSYYVSTDTTVGAGTVTATGGFELEYK